MNVSVVRFRPTFKQTKNGTKYYDQEALKANVRALSEGVEGVRSTEARYITQDEWLLLQQMVPGVCRGGTVEVYANGAKNIFFHLLSEASLAEGFLKVRPEEVPNVGRS